jgi:hypothetical protein
MALGEPGRRRIAPSELTFCAFRPPRVNDPGWILAQLEVENGPPAGFVVGQVWLKTSTEPAAGRLPCFLR